ncbi:hypothetical protein DFH27DRAFT_525046 [Peziza echinospora]|nr:hypothetical protein DFH27DRAFT_525046 [Peziza echinospora]
MRGGSASNNSPSIASPVRSLSKSTSPRSSTPSSNNGHGSNNGLMTAPTSPSGIAGFSTITINRHPSSSPSTGSSGGGGGDGNSAAHQPLSHSGNSSRDSSPASDLNEEVATLSNKLIKAINHQTLLDDSLTSTRHELELSRARIKQLEAVARDHEQMMAKGLLVDRKDMETEHEQFMKRLKNEQTQRSKAERDKKTIEQELEHLTSALFEEANKMVSAARRERDVVDRKNEQLRAQLADTELLVASHQEQLAELKLVMQQITSERERDEQPEINFSRPSSPALGNRASKESLGRMFDAVSLSPSYSNHTEEQLAPAYPTSYHHLITPVLRHDTAAYQDFLTLLRSPKTQSNPPGVPGTTTNGASNGLGSYRLSTGSLPSFQVMGMGMNMPGISSFTPNHSPTTSVAGPTVGNGAYTPSSPSTPSPPIVALKETRFYKRVLVEDIEPTLRLDLAPGLSWLAKRNSLSAITDGTLLIDPLTPASRTNMLASCTLCGESRNEDPIHVRGHCMRTSETDNAQKYPLCGYCVNRVRATCDFVGFLKMCKEGFWKCENESDEKHAWEVCTGNRERMFWSRVGGGVVPANMGHHYNGYYQGSVFGGRNSLEFPMHGSPRKVSGMSTGTTAASLRGPNGGGSVMERRRSSLESQAEEKRSEDSPPLQMQIPPPPPPKTPEPKADLVVTKRAGANITAATPPPPVLPPKAKAAVEANGNARKDPSLSPLRRIWTLGANRVLGGGSNSNTSSPVNTSKPPLGPPISVEEAITTSSSSSSSSPSSSARASTSSSPAPSTVPPTPPSVLKSVKDDIVKTILPLPSVVGGAKKENIPPPLAPTLPPLPASRPQTPAQQQQVVFSAGVVDTPQRVEEEVDGEDVTDSPSSTRAVYRRDREDSLAGSVLVAQRGIALAEKEKEARERAAAAGLVVEEQEEEAEVVQEQQKQAMESPAVPGAWN